MEQISSADEAINWVNQNKKKIISYSNKLIPFSPYTRSDFLQQAYESALIAVGIAVEKKIGFEATFWTVYKRHCHQLLDPTRPTNGELNDEFDLESYFASDPDPFPEIFKKNGFFEPDCNFLVSDEVVLEKGLSVMTARERQVWELLLGLYGKICSTEEIAASLGSISTRRVLQLRDSGLERVKIRYQSSRLISISPVKKKVDRKMKYEALLKIINRSIKKKAPKRNHGVAGTADRGV